MFLLNEFPFLAKGYGRCFEVQLCGLQYDLFGERNFHQSIFDKFLQRLQNFQTLAQDEELLGMLRILTGIC